MDQHQAGQEETLVKVRIATDSLEVSRGPRSSRAKCAFALATVMGLLVVVLAAGFILHCLLFHPSCNKEAPPKNDPIKVNITCHPQGSGQERYNIFTAKKGATYLIDGWVKFSRTTNEKIELKQWHDNVNNLLKDKILNETEVSFFQKVKLASHSTISIHFKSNCIDSKFHIYEL